MPTPDELKRAREALGLSQSALAALVGITQPAIRKIETGETTRSRYMPEVLRVLGFREAALEMRDAEEEPVPNILGQTPFSDSLIPILGLSFSNSKTAFSEHFRVGYDKTPVRFVQRPWFLTGYKFCFGFRVANQIMSPAFNTDDIVILNPSSPVGKGNNVAVIKQTTSETIDCTLYQLEGWDQKSWNMRTHNPSDISDVPRGDWDFIFRVVARIEE